MFTQEGLTLGTDGNLPSNTEAERCHEKCLRLEVRRDLTLNPNLAIYYSPHHFSFLSINLAFSKWK